MSKPNDVIAKQIDSTALGAPSYALIEATAKQLREDLRVDKWLIDLRSGDAEKVKQTLSALPRDQETMARLQRAYAADKKNPHANLAKDIEVHLSKADAENLKVTIENPESKFARLETAASRIKDAHPNSSEIAAATRDLRQQLSILNSVEIDAANQESLTKNGKSLAQTFLAIPSLHQADKIAIHILLKGSDERAKMPQLNAQMAVEAVKAKDLDMLREGLGNSPEARQIFSERGQLKLLAAAFSDKDLKIAQDIAVHGETQISTLVELNKGLFGCDKDGVSQAIRTLSSEQSKGLIRGHELTNLKTSPANATKADIEAIEAYRAFKQAIDANFSKADAEELKALAIKTFEAAKIAGGATRSRERTNINEQIGLLRAAIVSDKSLTRVQIDDIKETLGQVKAQDRGTLHDLYAERYGDNLTDILAKIPKEEQASVAGLLQSSQQSRAEQIEQLGQQRKQSESGLLGSVDFADRYTAIQNNDTFRKASETASSKFQNVAAEKEQRLFNNASESYSQWQNEKADKANLITDGAIIGGSLLLSGGLSAPVIFGAAAVGGSIKVVGSKTLIGDSYGSTEQLAIDFSRGSLNTVFNTIGPAQAARFLKLGGNVSHEAGQVVIAKSAEELGKQAVFKRVATEQSLILGSAYVGGAGSGTVESLARWDGAKSNEDNIKRTFRVANETGIASGIGALALGGLIHTGSRFFKSSENSLGYYTGKTPAGTRVDVGVRPEPGGKPEVVSAAAPQAANSHVIDRPSVNETIAVRGPGTDSVPELGRGNPAREWPEKTITRTKAADGKVTYFDSANDRTITFNQRGRLIHAKEGEFERSFSYSLDGRLKSIAQENVVISREGKNSWILRQTNSDGTIASERQLDGNFTVNKSGSFTFTGLDGQPVTTKIDSTYFQTRLGRNEYLTANLEHQMKQLSRFAKDSFPEAARLTRFNQFLNEFEQSRLIRSISDEQKALFTLHLNRLLKPSRTAVLSQAERADLAEQIVWHAAHPNTVDQGAHQTCNVTTLEVRNYSRDPERNAQLIADIATKGKFVTAGGTRIDMTKLDFGLRPDNEALRALKLQNGGKSEALKEDGARDWSSQIIQTAMVNAHWQGESHFILNGQKKLFYEVTYDRQGKIIVNTNSSAEEVLLFDKEGNSFKSRNVPRQVFDARGQAIENFDRSKVVQNLSGNSQLIDDQSQVVKLYDSLGNRLSQVSPGTNGYDAEGNLIFRATKPGNSEIKYDLVTSQAFQTEGVFYNTGGQWVTLIGHDGSRLNGPGIADARLASTNRLTNGLDESGYVIRGSNSAAEWQDIREVSNANELGDALLELEEAGNLPAILNVHTSNQPFAKITGNDSAGGQDGGSHVINIHKFNPKTRMVQFTNQWGPEHDYLGEGFSIDELFETTKNPGQ
ncbi:MAG: hypothetical protein Q8T09_01955 [Candidatus Melainabacteria bacterium]|nr:hypothetical protein [Candidatus Melainabacteria bacterium]